MDRDRVVDLIRAILRLGFTDLRPEYLPPATDMPTYELVLWTGRRPRSVVDGGSAPWEFWAMAALVDAVVEEVDWRPVMTREPRARDSPAASIASGPETPGGAGEQPAGGPSVDEGQDTVDSQRAAEEIPLRRRADGLVYCCDTLGWVDEATAFDHRWDTSRSYDEYVSERASAWDGIEPGE